MEKVELSRRNVNRGSIRLLKGDRTEVVGQAIDLSLSDLRKDLRRVVSQLVGRLMAMAGVGGEETTGEGKREGGVKEEIGNGDWRVATTVAGVSTVRVDWWCPSGMTLDQAGGACLRQMLGHESEVRSVAFSPDGQYVVTGSDDNTVRLWSKESGELLRTMNGHTSRVVVLSVSFSPDGQSVVSGSLDETVRLWSVESGELLQTMEEHTSVVTSVCFSPDGQSVVSGSYDNMVRLWLVELLRTTEFGIFYNIVPRHSYNYHYLSSRLYSVTALSTASSNT